jgi:hypothetical protein
LRSELKERIRAHVVLCWRLLIRIIETRTDQTWHHVRRRLDRLHAAPSPAGYSLLWSSPG